MYLTSEFNAGDDPLVDSYSLQGWALYAMETRDKRPPDALWIKVKKRCFHFIQSEEIGN